MTHLVVAVHPDDETLGCGGTMLRHVAEGQDVALAIVTQAHSPRWPEDVVAQKLGEVERVSAAYGLSSLHRLGFPAIQLDEAPRGELMDALRDVVREVRPEIVYVTHSGDAHAEHTITFDALMSVLRSFHLRELGVRRILTYETISSTDAAPPLPARAFLPQVFVDVSDHLERKLEIMALYETEAQADPLPRGPSAIRALARARGATIGVEYAEAFALIRELV